MRRKRGFGVNPWTTHTRFIVSHRLLIDEAYTRPAARLAGRLPRPRALLILDEAHHAAPASGQKYAIDSQITRAVREPGAAVRASPVPVGHAAQRPLEQLLALLEILDPQRFTRGVPVRTRTISTP